MIKREQGIANAPSIVTSAPMYLMVPIPAGATSNVYTESTYGGAPSFPSGPFGVGNAPQFQSRPFGVPGGIVPTPPSPICRVIARPNLEQQQQQQKLPSSISRLEASLKSRLLYVETIINNCNVRAENVSAICMKNSNRRDLREIAVGLALTPEEMQKAHETARRATTFSSYAALETIEIERAVKAVEAEYDHIFTNYTEDVAMNVYRVYVTCFYRAKLLANMLRYEASH